MHGHGHHHGYEEEGFGGGAFGVRRPLRFLAYKLELNEQQVASLATVLNDLKTERAQAAVDDRRTTAAFADAVAGEVADEARLKEIAGARVKSAERLRDAVANALAKIHALLDPAQRQRLAYLIRTGTLSI
jgi:Spy/CpxP family protein refolding chaperone